MNGRVDNELRALLNVRVGKSGTILTTSIDVWIDTAFNGFLVFPKHMIDQLDLQQEAATEAILADGSLVTLESFVCRVEWFGQIIPAQVIANEGKLPLLGTEFLANRKLIVDYLNRTLSIS